MINSAQNQGQPTVSIIIPCRNEVDSIEGCLRSILEQDYPRHLLEVIVVDGRSTDGTREILREISSGTRPGWAAFPGGGAEAQAGGGVPWKLVVLDNPDRITSKALNLAIRSASGEVIVRMDCHTEYASDYVTRCVEVLVRTGAANVGGPARTKSDGYVQRAISAAYHSPFSTGGARFHNVMYEGEVDTVTYGCWWKASFEVYGYFDEELVRNQDDEHNLRIVRAGGRIWQSPAIRSWYQPRPSLSALFRQYAQYGYWKVRVIQKHAIPASWRHLVPGAFVLGLALCLAASFFIPAAAWAALGLAVLYGTGLLGASLITALRSGWGILPILPVVFATYHFGYGWGFNMGLVQFILLGRRAGKSFSGLTRGAGGGAS